MKIYQRSPRAAGGLHVLYVAPAAEDPSANVAEWQKPDGTPATLEVRFVEGAAEVKDNLGRFLCDRKYAQRSRPLLVAA